MYAHCTYIRNHAAHVTTHFTSFDVRQLIFSSCHTTCVYILVHRRIAFLTAIYWNNGHRKMNVHSCRNHVRMRHTFYKSRACVTITYSSLRYNFGKLSSRKFLLYVRGNGSFVWATFSGAFTSRHIVCTLHRNMRWLKCSGFEFLELLWYASVNFWRK